MESSVFAGTEELPALHESFLFVYGDNLDATSLWRDLLRQARVFRDNLQALGTKTCWLEMPQEGIYGNSHMIMIDDNSEAIDDRICEWRLLT